MTDASVYRLRDVRKSHGRGFELQVESFDGAEGAVHCLLGPTGAGKSTLLRLLSGLERVDAGEIWHRDHPLHRGPLSLARQRTIAFVHQRPLLLNASARYNVEYGLRLRRACDARARADEAIERLNLQDVAAQNALTLSGGQTQLVALARALVLAPDVLLLDEPTANLDPAHVALVESVVADLRRASPMTIVWATHNLFQARRVADRVSLLLNGHIVETAAAAEFFESPRDDRTKAFVEGRMIY